MLSTIRLGWHVERAKSILQFLLRAALVLRDNPGSKRRETG